LFHINVSEYLVQPSTRNVTLKNRGAPELTGVSFIAPSATVVGQVKIGTSSSVWYGAVVRGDVNSITIGNDVTIGDMAMIHCSGVMGEAPTVIGNRVVVGVGATIHGATLHDESRVEDRATVLDGAVVSKHAVVAAGSLVPNGKVIPVGQLWAGVPVRYVRDLTAAEIAGFSTSAFKLAEWAAVHQHECDKTWQVIEEEEEFLDQQNSRHAEYFQPISDEMRSKNAGEVEGHQVPGRIFNSKISASNAEDCRESSYKQ
jgi:carbonic anhydrase/acetyltransferase-like protein (isoleucine patch superfamily)